MALPVLMAYRVGRIGGRPGLFEYAIRVRRVIARTGSRILRTCVRSAAANHGGVDDNSFPSYDGVAPMNFSKRLGARRFVGGGRGPRLMIAG